MLHEVEVSEIISSNQQAPGSRTRACLEPVLFTSIRVDQVEFAFLKRNATVTDVSPNLNCFRVCSAECFSDPEFYLLSVFKNPFEDCIQLFTT